ncbi:hypothetical protein CUJ89_20060 [Burkholderia pyrrocinia]|uniref:Uncharacterized protein n=1 Tax=Burkholderia pyrrocinia TaxID=60550 RepID=A0A2Z5MZS0_BURPY|nr:hypothetical protein [Burkholderia pyrrocinia]AXF22801.1 hypothetical protein CUJ89_20060 [Burkholderia pyrrocinia]
MTGFSKSAEAQPHGGHRVSCDQTIDVEPSPVSPGSNGIRRDHANWAWAGSSAHYDWMDLAPLFTHRD